MCESNDDKARFCSNIPLCGFFSSEGENFLWQRNQEQLHKFQLWIKFSFDLESAEIRNFAFERWIYRKSRFKNEVLLIISPFSWQNRLKSIEWLI